MQVKGAVLWTNMYTGPHSFHFVFIPLLVVRLFHIFYLESFPAQVSVNEAQPETQIDNYTAGFTPKHLTYGHWPWAEQFRVRIWCEMGSYGSNPCRVMRTAIISPK